MLSRPASAVALTLSSCVVLTAPATAQTCPGDDIYEPNQSCATAVPLTMGTTPGLAIVGSDHDMWSFVVPPGEDLVIDVLFLHASGNLDVKLVTSDCNTLIDRGDSADDNEHVAGHNSGATSEIMVLHVYSVGSSFVCNDYSVVAAIGQPNIQPYCFGDPGSGTPCPCANDNDGSVPGSGCDNGIFHSGAQLSSSGNASVSSDTLVLATTGLEPNNTGLYFQANNAVNGGNGNPFGDGLRCAGGGLIRLQIRTATSAGTSQTSVAIATKGGVTAGDTKRYQCWYRTTQNPPCGLGLNDFNLSNGLEVVWQP